MRTGYPDDWKRQLEWLAALPHKVKLYVPGNHDFHLQVYPGPALQEMRNIGVTVVGLPGNDHYAAYTLPNAMSLLGLPYVVNLPRWAFNIEEEKLEAILKRIQYHHIIVSHAPPMNCLDEIKGKHVGISAYWEHALQRKPKHWIFGHIHEGYGTLNSDYLGMQFHNVAMCNRAYEHVNAPLVLDL
jgi:hypothetical protein